MVGGEREPEQHPLQHEPSHDDAGAVILGPAGIRVYDDVISRPMFDEIALAIRMRGWSYGWKSNTELPFGHWNISFGGRKRANRSPCIDELSDPLRAIWTAVQPVVMPETPTLIRCYANAHTFGIEGHVHVDSAVKTDQTAVTYLVENWTRDWAGELLFFNEDEVMFAVTPKFLRTVVFPSHLPHAARAISRLCPFTRECFVFKAAT